MREQEKHSLTHMKRGRYLDLASIIIICGHIVSDNVVHQGIWFAATKHEHGAKREESEHEAERGGVTLRCNVNFECNK